MSIQYVSGDLFVNRYNAEALAHGCNCQGAMGAGIAEGFRQRYREMYQYYRHLCKTQPRQFNPGGSLFWSEEGKPSVFNLGTQEDYWSNRATVELIQEALEMMRAQADSENIHSIAMPRIGTGYGGLDWQEIHPIVEHIFADWPGTLYVYERYDDGT